MRRSAACGWRNGRLRHEHQGMVPRAPRRLLCPAGPASLVDYACDNDLPLALAVEPLAAQRGSPSGWSGQRAGDQRRALRDLTPLRTAANIDRWSSVVWLGVRSPPFNRNDAPTAPWCSSETVPALPRTLRAAIRTASGARHPHRPDWGILMPRPTFQSDGFHLMDGAYAAAGSTGSISSAHPVSVAPHRA